LKPYQRPWWALAIQMPILATTLQEDHHADQKRFIIEGSPTCKSLTWITYGPALAMLVVISLGLLAWDFEVRSQAMTIKLLVVCAMVLLPALGWVVGGSIINRRVQKALEQQIQANKEHVELTLDLTARTFQLNQAPPIPFNQINGFKLVSNAGIYYDPNEEMGSLFNLALETNRGPITLLKSDLGATRQKLQLAGQLQALIAPFSDHSRPM